MKEAIVRSSARKRTCFTDLLPLFVIFIVMLLAAVFCAPSKTSYNDEVTDLTYGWTDDSGTVYTMGSLPDGDITLSHDLNGVDIYRKRLCFISTDTTFAVSFDDGSKYAYSPKQAPMPKQAESPRGLFRAPVFLGREFLVFESYYESRQQLAFQ